ncbi:hypothetical protein Tco_0132308 [Tanacetum coccineum]
MSGWWWYDHRLLASNESPPSVAYTNTSCHPSIEYPHFLFQQLMLTWLKVNHENLLLLLGDVIGGIQKGADDGVDKGTDNANITRKRSKTRQTRTRERIECTRARDLIAKRAGRVRHHKRLLLVEALKKGHAANGKKHTNDWIFALKLVQKKHKGLTHGMPRWQSVCSLNQSNGHKDRSNDGQRIKVRDYKERVTDSRPRSFISAL